MGSSLLLYSSSLLRVLSSQGLVVGAEQPPCDDGVTNMIKKATGWQRRKEKSQNRLGECTPPSFPINKQYIAIQGLCHLLLKAC